MIVQRATGIHLLSTCVKAVTASVLFGAMMGLLSNIVMLPEGAETRYPLYYVCILLGLIVSGLTKKDIRDSNFDSNLIRCNQESFREMGMVIFFLCVFLVVTKDPVISRRFLLSYLLVLFPVLFLINRYVPRGIAKRLFRGSRRERTVIVGLDDSTDSLVQWLKNKMLIGIDCVGIISSNNSMVSEYGLPILGNIEDLDEIIEKYEVTQLIVNDSYNLRSVIPFFAEICEKKGVRFLMRSDMARILKHPVSYIEDEGLLFIGMREEPLENPFNRVSKRVLDLMVSAFVILFILPFSSFLVWILHCLQSPGPLFIKQKRSGIQNKPFTILKYRTMKPVRFDEAKQATKNDNRVFQLGKWLRRLSIDELPQFINVWRGQMSVVGPRPHLLEHNNQFSKAMRNYHIRSFVKPGITGLAQVRGHRGEIKDIDDIRNRLRSDIFYIEHWSLLLDTMVIIRTVWHVVFPPKSAY